MGRLVEVTQGVFERKNERKSRKIRVRPVLNRPPDLLDEESKKENEELKELIKELRETHNQKVKSQTDLLASIDRLTKQVADITEDNRRLRQQIDKLLNLISVSGKGRF